MIDLSIVCPTYQEEKHIQLFLDSVIQQEYNKEFEVLIIDGMSTDNTRSIISEYAQKYQFIKLMDNPNRTVPFALNIGIKASRGKIIIRMDAHCIYPTNYFSTLTDTSIRLNAENVGGVWKTIPAYQNSKCIGIAIASSHKFGVGDAKYKLGTKKIVQVDTVPFGCYKKETFEKIGLFDEDLIRNQDDEFNARLINNGGKIYLIPDLVIEYMARDSIKKMSKMFFQYGLFKPLVNKKLGKPATIRQFFPALFLLGLLAGLIFSILSISRLLTVLFFAILLIYFSIGFIIGMQHAIKNRNSNLIYLLPFNFLVIHLSYGWGYWDGIYRVLFNRKFNVQSNR